MMRFLTALVLAAFALAAQATVDANRASQAELETVKGVGPGLSGKILAARKAGEFKNWTDLVDRVGGIGPGNASRFSQAGLTVAGATFDGKAATMKPATAKKEPQSTRAAQKAAGESSR